MLVLIDESGCCGFKLGKGSTPIFAAAMVIFEDYTQAENASAAIRAKRIELSVHPEFKFSNSRDAVKDAFFETVLPYDFVVRAIVVEKSKIYSPHLKRVKGDFYRFFVQTMMKHDNDVLKNANVKIDGSGDRVFKRELHAYLRAQLGSGKISKLRFVNSKSDSLIQLADMSVGAIARSYRTDRVRPDRWRTMLAPKIKDVWEFQ